MRSGSPQLCPPNPLCQLGGGGFALFLAATRSTPQFPAMQNLLLLSFRGIKKKKFIHIHVHHIGETRTCCYSLGGADGSCPGTQLPFPSTAVSHSTATAPGRDRTGNYQQRCKSATSLNQA